MPFRSARKQHVAEKPETGAVAEMVRQFADPFAFVRELVQNSIDAGATTLSIRVERAGGITTTALHDDGVGMNRETIDGPLLTLFNSSKEGDSTKIGKYGVGFVSVFAIDPDIVEVDTWRDGERHRVRLFRDHRYEIEKLEPLPDSGTAVTLHQSMDAEKFDEHRLRLETALSRWCRFAAIPIEFSSVDHDRNDPAASRRIDVHLSVPSSLYVQANRDKERFVVGPSAGTDRFMAPGAADDDPAKDKTTFAGFYNRGLTLFETDEPLHPALANVRLRVDSPNLRHTLSRDNVLRDKAFDRIIAKARDLVQKSLRRELTSRLARAAQELADAKPPYEPELVASYGAFLEAALLHPLDIPHSEIMVPLAGWRLRENVMSLKQIMSLKSVYAVYATDELSRAMTQIYCPVVLAPDPKIQSWLALCIPPPGPMSPNQKFVVVHESPDSELTDSDRALCLMIENNLKVLRLPSSHVGITSAVDGIDEPFVRMQRRGRQVYDKCWLYVNDPVEEVWFNMDLSSPLLLVATNEAVRLAREHAKKDTFMAAHMLMRFMLLSGSDKDGSLSDAFFSTAAMEIV